MGGDALLWLSRALGYSYTVAWCLSFHPQAWKNYKRQSVSGFSLDFAWSNVFGFVAYSAYNVPMFFDSTVRQQYANRHGGTLPPVQPNDVVFPLYALVATTFTLAQTFYYPRDKGQRLAPLVIAALLMFGLTSVFASGLVLLGRLEWLDVLEIAAGIKLLISAAKYSPQVYENYKRQSTAAWSIGQIWLDGTGGLLSTAQLFLDAFRLNNPQSLLGSGLPKLGLGLLAISFDAIFLVQHYYLYAGNKDGKDDGNEEEREQLLSQNGQRRASEDA